MIRSLILILIVSLFSVVTCTSCSFQCGIDVNNTLECCDLGLVPSSSNDSCVKYTEHDIDLLKFCYGLDSNFYLTEVSPNVFVKNSCDSTQVCDGISIVSCASNAYVNSAAKTDFLHCSSCPAGYSCDGISKLECTSGSYAPESSGQCIQCQENSYSVDGAESCTICPSSAVCENGLLMGCAPDFFLPPFLPSFESCTECLLNATCSDNSLKCDDGLFLIYANSSLECNSCSDYYNALTYSCDPCPANSTCLNGNITMCDSNSYLDDNICHPCPSFSVCDGLSVIRCASNSFLPSNSSTCTSCPAGHYCNGTHAQPCAAGDFSPEGVGFCSFCDNGLLLPDASDCLACPTYTSCSSGIATGCAENAYLKDFQPLKKSVWSSIKSYLVKSAVYDFTLCEACPPNYYCDDNMIVSCASNSYRIETNESYYTCDTCPLGSTCNGSTIHEVCADTRFCIEGNDYDCLSFQYCIAGIPYECGQHKMCFGGAEEDCPEGYKCNNGIHVQCKNQFYCTGGQQYDCPELNFCILGIARNCTLGSKCSNGFIYPCDDEKLCIDGVQKDCPPNSICKKGLISKCDPTFQLVRKNEIGSCEPCKPGYNCDGSTVSYKCSSSQYVPENTTTCTQCPSGHSCDGLTATACSSNEFAPTGSGICSTCNSGILDANHSTCTPCPLHGICDGSFVSCENSFHHLEDPISGLISCDTCDGYYNSSSLSCYTCPNHALCDGTSIVNCVSSAYLPPDASGDLRFCSQCPSGHECDGVHATKCAIGHYSPAGLSNCSSCDGIVSIDQGLCSKCPESNICGGGIKTGCAEQYYIYQTNQTTINGNLDYSLCIPCPEGGNCMDDLFVSCTSGNFIIDNADSYTCNACETTFYNITSSRCDSCPVNTECAHGSIIGCAIGYFIPQKPIHSTDFINDCVPCPAGSYCIDAIINECPVGYFCPPIIGIPISCPDGFFSNVTSSANCNKCPDYMISSNDRTFCIYPNINIHKTNTGAIIGGCVGGLVGLMGIGGVIYYILRPKKIRGIPLV